MGDGASPAYAVGDVVLATHDDGKTYSAKVIDTRTKDGVALECLPTKEGMLVGILLVKPGDAKTCASAT